MGYRILIIIVSFFISGIAFAHQHDSIPKDSQKVEYFYQLNEINSDRFEIYHIDTSICGFQHINPLKKSSFFNSQTGVTGSPYKNLEYNFPKSYFEVFTGFQQFDNLRLSLENTKIYQSNASFTEALYSMGPNREQFFDLYHKQQIFKRLDAGVNYRIMHALGNYFRQKTDDSQVSFYSKFENEKKNYGFQLNYIYNRLSFNENGGLSYPTYFEDSSVLNRRIIPVNLDEADNSLKESVYHFQHYFNVYKKELVKKDTIETTTKKFVGQLFHSVDFSLNRQSYADVYPLGGYYNTINYDSTLTFDSLTLKIFENTFGITNFKFDSEERSRIRFKGGISYQYIEVKQREYLYYYNQLKPFAFTGIRFSKTLDLRGYGELFLGGYKEGDFKLQGELDYHQQKENGIRGKAKLNINLKQPGLFTEKYFSNHFLWENLFNKEKIIELSLDGNFKGFELKGAIINIHDYVYFDTLAQPSQISSPIQVVKLSIGKKFNFGKFGNYNQLLFQSASNEDVLRLPDLSGYNSLFYTFNVFSNVLKVQLGVDVWYSTSYYADSYMPATRQFYIQDEKEIKSYAYVDAFANFRLKKARFFLKFEHVNAGLFGYNYYTVPYYPMYDRVFRFGVAWKFYN